MTAEGKVNRELRGMQQDGEQPMSVTGGPRSGQSRVDAYIKASGQGIYAGDVRLPGMAHVALARSSVPHARIAGVDTEAARHSPGVIGVFSSEDLSAGTFGRRVRDIPVLAAGKVRFIGEPVAAVVAESRREAEAAAGLVAVEYQELPAVFDVLEALESNAAPVHDAPWGYPGSVIGPGDGPNLQSRVQHGSQAECERALGEAVHIVDAMFETPSSHQGYLEPQACVARVRPDGCIELWISNKTPYRLREQVASCLGLDPANVIINPVLLGGDFGGKGSPGGAPLCAELARLTGRPVSFVLRYGEELTTTNPSHPTKIHVLLAADGEGRLVALRVDAAIDGGAYAGFKPLPKVNLHGIDRAGSSYRIPAVYIDARIAYTNTVPKGHFRAPGSPSVTFAVESALDELAEQCGLSPVEIRQLNVLRAGEASLDGVVWAEARGAEVLDAAVGALVPLPVPAGWRYGWGIALYDRPTGVGKTSMRLRSLAGGRLCAEVPIPETGTGSHTVVREELARVLGMDRAAIDVVHVPTDSLPNDAGVGGSRVTASMGEAVHHAAAAWRSRANADAVVVEVDTGGSPPVTSFCAQIAQVAVDPESGYLKVMEVLTALDVATIVNPIAHRMQIEAGAAMGFGFACLEDLLIEDGQVWAAHLGEFRIPSAADIPRWRTVLLTGSVGVGALNVKAVGELANVPTAAAIANAVAMAVGVRLRNVPMRAECIFTALATSKRFSCETVGASDVTGTVGPQ